MQRVVVMHPREGLRNTKETILLSLHRAEGKCEKINFFIKKLYTLLCSLNTSSKTPLLHSIPGSCLVFRYSHKTQSDSHQGFKSGILTASQTMIHPVK